MHVVSLVNIMESNETTKILKYSFLKIAKLQKSVQQSEKNTDLQNKTPRKFKSHLFIPLFFY